MINLETGESRCFGFVRFETLEQAQAAIRGLNGKQIGSKILLAKYAQSQEKKKTVSKTIYINRIPLELDQNNISEIFSSFGQIEQFTPQSFPDPQYWACFIKYTSFESTANAISSMNNKIIFPNSWPIHVNYAETRISGTIPNVVFPQQNSLGPIPLQNSENILEEPERQLLPSFLFM